MKEEQGQNKNARNHKRTRERREQPKGETIVEKGEGK